MRVPGYDLASSVAYHERPRPHHTSRQPTPRRTQPPPAPSGRAEDPAPAGIARLARRLQHAAAGPVDVTVLGQRRDVITGRRRRPAPHTRRTTREDGGAAPAVALTVPACRRRALTGRHGSAGTRACRPPNWPAARRHRGGAPTTATTDPGPTASVPAGRSSSGRLPSTPDRRRA